MDPRVQTAFGIFSAVVTVASIAANFFPPNTIAFKILHFLALNGPDLQAAAAKAADKK